MSEALFINLVYKASISELYSLLRSSSLDLHNCKDSRGMSALHIASLNGNLSVIKFMVEYSKKFYKSSEKLKAWANISSEEGFLAAHFASFRGHLVTFI
jgi:ankyrin repeat protein